MPLDLQRLARVRAHLLAATALVTAGCGSNSAPEHTINEPVHINRPPDATPSATPDATPSATPNATPDNPGSRPLHINTPDPGLASTKPATPTPSATPSATPAAKPPASPKPDPIHINRPNPNR